MEDNAPEVSVSDNVLVGDVPSAAPAPIEGQAAESESTGWLGNFNEDQQAYINNKGWGSLEENEATQAMLTSYQNIEKLKNVDGKDLFNIQADMDPEAREKVYQALGRPDAPENYSIEVGEGDIPELADWYKGAAHKHGLSDTQAAGIYAEFNEQMNGMASSSNEGIAAAHQQGIEAIQKEWGNAWESKVNVATRAAEHHGITQDMQIAIKEAGLAPEFLKAMASVGTMMGEGQMVGTSPTDAKAAVGMLSPKEAASQRDKMINNPEFKARMYSQNAETRKAAAAELQPLYKAMSGS